MMADCMWNDLWLFAVNSVREALERDGAVAAEKNAQLWTRNVAFDASKLLAEARASLTAGNHNPSRLGTGEPPTL